MLASFELNDRLKTPFWVHFGRKVTAQKMKTAGATGVLALQEHGLKEVPGGLFLLVKLRVREGRGEVTEVVSSACIRGTCGGRGGLVVVAMKEGTTLQVHTYVE